MIPQRFRYRTLAQRRLLLFPTRASILVLIAAIGLSISACGGDSSMVTVASLQEELAADQESWNVLLNISDNGLPRVRLMAEHVLQFDRPDSTFMLLESVDVDSIRVRVDIFDERGDSSAVVFANRIYYYELENRFVAQGAVVVVAREDRRIESEHLVWTEADRKVRTPGFATIMLPNQTVAGYSLEANEDLTEATLSRVTGTYTSEEE